MKNTTKIFLAAATVFLTGAVWVMARHDKAPVPVANAAPPIASTQPSAATVAAAVQNPTTAPVAVLAMTPVVPAAAVDRVAEDGSTKHIAQPGDTLGGMAEDILGKNSAANREAIVNANSSLKADPDKLLAGKAYRIPSPEQVVERQADAAAVATTAPPAAVETVVTEKAPVEKVQATKTSTAQPDADQIVAGAAPRTLRYTAREGDTVTTLATQLLGSDTKEARDAIINNNPSLKQNPDHLVAGQTYWIPAPTSAAGNP